MVRWPPAYRGAARRGGGLNCTSVGSVLPVSGRRLWGGGVRRPYRPCEGGPNRSTVQSAAPARRAAVRWGPAYHSISFVNPLYLSSCSTLGASVPHKRRGGADPTELQLGPPLHGRYGRLTPPPHNRRPETGGAEPTEVQFSPPPRRAAPRYAGGQRTAQARRGRGANRTTVGSAVLRGAVR